MYYIGNVSGFELFRNALLHKRESTTTRDLNIITDNLYCRNYAISVVLYRIISILKPILFFLLQTYFSTILVFFIIS